MILIVNLNLTVDRIMEVPDLQLGGVHRAIKTDLQAGGKGINVARTLRALGEEYEVIGFAAGRTGDYIDARLGEEGINHSLIRIAGDSRTSVILLEPGSGRQTVINEYGPIASTDDINRFFGLYQERLVRCSFVVMSGSVPPGETANANNDIYTHLIGLAKHARKPTLLDAAGEFLRHGAMAQPTIIKPNQFEAEAICDCHVDSTAAALAACRRLIEFGAEIGAVTLGSQGMAVANRNEAYLLKPPVIKARNAVGAGDATAAGFAAAYVRGYSLPKAAKLAVACGAASALHGFGRATREEIEALEPEVISSDLAASN